MNKSSVILAWLLVLGWMEQAPAQTGFRYPPPSEKCIESGNFQPATSVKAILFAQTSDKGIGKGCAANLTAMEMFVRGLPKFHPETDLIVLKDEDATGVNILKAVKRMSVKNTETLFVYVAGHGGYEDEWYQKDRNPLEPSPVDSSNGHILQMSDGLLRRRDLVGAMRSKNAKLTVLITDTCNIPLEGLAGISWGEEDSDPKTRQPPAIEPVKPTAEVEQKIGESFESYIERRMTTHVPATKAHYVLPTQSDKVKLESFKRTGLANFQQLLYLHEGIVDVSGTTRTESGWYNADGGWFTIGLVQALGESTYIDLRPDAGFSNLPCHWLPFLKLTSERVSDVFFTRKKVILEHGKPTTDGARKAVEELKGQTYQRSKIFQLEVVHGDK